MGILISPISILLAAVICIVAGLWFGFLLLTELQENPTKVGVGLVMAIVACVAAHNLLVV